MSPPERSPRGSGEAGRPRQGDPMAAPECMWSNSPLRVASSCGRHCFALRGLARFCRNPMGRGFAGCLL
jgi:hypothetical protein